jgi:hypothetical protein
MYVMIRDNRFGSNTQKEITFTGLGAILSAITRLNAEEN